MSTPARRQPQRLKITSADLLDMLRRHHGLNGPAEEWSGGLFVHEVSANAQFGAGRRADALYMGFTAASGRCLIGYELKTSRADWRRELKNAAHKADQWVDECHEWWIVVPDPSIVKLEELPAGWGLLSPPAPGTHVMTVHARAQRKGQDHSPSWHAMRAVLSRLESLRAKTIQGQLQQIRMEEQQKAHQRVLAEFAQCQGPDTGELQRRLDGLERALGVRIDWGDGKAGPSYKFFPVMSLEAVEQMATAMRAYGNVENAVAAVADRFAEPIDGLTKALDRLKGVTSEKNTP